MIERARIGSLSGASVTWLRSALFFANTNRVLTGGLVLGGIILLLAYVGPFVIDHDNSRLGAASPRLSPNAQHLFGTDTQGRDVLTVWILGIGQTLKMALLAGIIGIVLGSASAGV